MTDPGENHQAHKSSNSSHIPHYSYLRCVVSSSLELRRYPEWTNLQQSFKQTLGDTSGVWGYRPTIPIRREGA